MLQTPDGGSFNFFIFDSLFSYTPSQLRNATKTNLASSDREGKPLAVIEAILLRLDGTGMKLHLRCFRPPYHPAKLREGPERRQGLEPRDVQDTQAFTAHAFPDPGLELRRVWYMPLGTFWSFPVCSTLTATTP